MRGRIRRFVKQYAVDGNVRRCLERCKQVLTFQHPLPDAPTFCVGHSLVSCRGRLGPLAESQWLHHLRSTSSTPIRGSLPSVFIPRTAQVPAPLTFGPSHRDGNGTMASADPCRLSLTSRLGLPFPWPGDRSPQVRTLTFPAPSPHLPHQPLIASGFIVTCQLAQLVRPLMRFVSLKSQVCLRLPSDPTSR